MAGRGGAWGTWGAGIADSMNCGTGKPRGGWEGGRAAVLGAWLPAIAAGAGEDAIAWVWAAAIREKSCCACMLANSGAAPLKTMVAEAATWGRPRP